jgi:hypothetical protein
MKCYRAAKTALTCPEHDRERQKLLTNLMENENVCLAVEFEKYAKVSGWSDG